MLANRQHSVSSSGSLSEAEDLFCCGLGVNEVEEATLEGRAVLVLAGMVEGAVVTPLGLRAMKRMAAYLRVLSSSMLTAVVTVIMSKRPRWLPLEYHWAPLDHDPLLLLLELLGSHLTVLTYSCHPLSREPLINALAAMPALTVLSLPEAADDNALAVVGAACHGLTTLCVRGSKGVTDDGMRRLLLRRHAYTRSRWRRLFSRWRSLRSSLSRQQARYRPIENALLVPADAEHLNPLSGTLVHLDLGGTKVSNQGVEWAKSILSPNAYVFATHSLRRSLRSQTSLEDQMARLLAPLTP
ncbi:uncharacterized protein LOC122265829 [Penaeus japonicus]|uniref:uncharacterized protein LOC122265829 n=1 Tax=Penaeus japonicus TaxID=27405 RepID=UPI001C715F10|nr:uncharacterized protein LOC122265829 [Penaeus japonicus]XP_042891193.1 uncharacterized protein LOC122265829 [Penaeus japonicus]